MVDFAERRWDEPSGPAATGWGPLYRLYKGSDRWFFLASGWVWVPAERLPTCEIGGDKARRDHILQLGR